MPKYFVEALLWWRIVLVITLIITSGGVSSNALGTVLPVVGLYVFAAYRLQPAFQSIFNGVSALRFGADVVNNIFRDLHIKFDDNPTRTFNKITFKRKISVKIFPSFTLIQIERVYLISILTFRLVHLLALLVALVLVRLHW